MFNGFINLNRYEKVMLCQIITFNRNFRSKIHTEIKVTTDLQRFLFLILCFIFQCTLTYKL